MGMIDVEDSERNEDGHLCMVPLYAWSSMHVEDGKERS